MPGSAGLIPAAASTRGRRRLLQQLQGPHRLTPRARLPPISLLPASIHPSARAHISDQSLTSNGRASPPRLKRNRESAHLLLLLLLQASLPPQPPPLPGRERRGTCRQRVGLTMVSILFLIDTGLALRKELALQLFLWPGPRRQSMQDSLAPFFAPLAEDAHSACCRRSSSTARLVASSISCRGRDRTAIAGIG